MNTAVGGHFGINPLDERGCGSRYLKGLIDLDPVAAESVGASGAIDCSWMPSLDQNSRPDYDGAWDLTTGDNRLWVGGGWQDDRGGVGWSSGPLATSRRRVRTMRPGRSPDPSRHHPLERVWCSIRSGLFLHVPQLLIKRLRAGA